MKKIFSLLLSLVLFFIPSAFADKTAEQSASLLSGTWYTDMSGVPMEMNLGEDGAYTIQILGSEPETGTWELRDGFIYLNGSASPEFNVMADKLLWSDAFTLFTREKNELYQPADELSEIPADFFRGYWKAFCVDVDGSACLASALNDTTDLYVEGNSMILGGPLFGDLPVKAESTDGALVCTAEGITVTLRMQQDGFLRMTMDTGEETMTWYLAAVAGMMPISGK